MTTKDTAPTEFDPRGVELLKKTIEELDAQGELDSPELLDRCYTKFRARFGPEVLAGLDGEALLTTMHGRESDHDNLMYWLEFKNDDEFPAKFGSIAGGSALKFGIYRRRETGEWTTGSPQKQHTISRDEAIDFARRQRDQLLLGVDLLRKLSGNAGYDEYRTLQQKMDQVAPDVSHSAWGHKYFSLLEPDKLESIHSLHHQRYHIVRMLRIPPEGDARYESAWHFVAMARHLGINLNWLAKALYHVGGTRCRYWRIGTSDGKTGETRWPTMRDGECVAVGWAKHGDLTSVLERPDLNDILKAKQDENYPGDRPQLVGRKAKQFQRFLTTIATRDIVVAMDGSNVLGIGRVTGDYVYDSQQPFPHLRPVRWLSFDEWKLPRNEGPRTTVHELRKYPENLVEIESRLLGGTVPPPVVKPPPGGGSKRRVPALDGVPGRIQAVLDRKSQVILYGPPGTGKTYWAERTAKDLAAYDSFGVGWNQLTDKQEVTLGVSTATSKGRIRFCSFHPAYGYEDFIEGYRPEERDGTLMFSLQQGIFRRLCRDAGDDLDHRYYLIIDEINRGDIPRIFGELLTVIEKSKRGMPILLPLTRKPFFVPPNVFVIGTMNTADRSIALLDTALRRRFGFVELMPDPSVLGNVVVEGIPVGLWLASLNERICQNIGQDARNLQIGHSYLMQGDTAVTSFGAFARIVQDDIIPLLEEYCYEDHTLLEKILGCDFIDSTRQQIRHELFDPSRKDDLLRALRAPCPELAATREAVASDAEADEDSDDLDETPDGDG